MTVDAKPRVHAQIVVAHHPQLNEVGEQVAVNAKPRVHAQIVVAHHPLLNEIDEVGEQVPEDEKPARTTREIGQLSGQFFLKKKVRWVWKGR